MNSFLKEILKNVSTSELEDILRLKLEQDKQPNSEDEKIQNYLKKNILKYKNPKITKTWEQYLKTP